MSLYDTLTLLKSQMHTGHMTPETAMDVLYQAAMNQAPDEPRTAAIEPEPEPAGKPRAKSK